MSTTTQIGDCLTDRQNSGVTIARAITDLINNNSKNNQLKFQTSVMLQVERTSEDGTSSQCMTSNDNRKEDFKDSKFTSPGISPVLIHQQQGDINVTDSDTKLLHPTNERNKTPKLVVLTNEKPDADPNKHPLNNKDSSTTKNHHGPISEHELIRLDQQLEKIWPEDFSKCSIECAKLAHEYYMHFAPPSLSLPTLRVDQLASCNCDNRRVNLMVLGESHAGTDANMLGLQLKKEYYQLSNEVDLIPGSSTTPFLGHLNLIHSFSYGEPSILRVPEGINLQRGIYGGTPQFWRLMFALAGESQRVEGIKKNQHRSKTLEEDTKKRLLLKAQIFEAMKRRKIYFGDVSPYAIYSNSDGIKTKHINAKTGKEYWDIRKIPTSSHADIICTIWDMYTKKVIDFFRPRYLLLLGKRIADELGKARIDALKELGVKVLPPGYSPSYNMMWGKRGVPLFENIEKISNVTATLQGKASNNEFLDNFEWPWDIERREKKEKKKQKIIGETDKRKRQRQSLS